MKSTSFALAMAVVCAPGMAAATEHAFRVPTTWAHDFARLQGWDEEDPRMLADVDGDGDQDVVGFGISGVHVGWAVPGQGFTVEFMLEEFGHDFGWRVDKHPLTMARLNQDDRADIVGFGDWGVYRALSTGHGFAPVGAAVLDDFGYEQGWRVDKHVRLMADISGDGLDDIVGFGENGVWFALADGSGGFETPGLYPEFGGDQGWFSSRHVRTMADVNGDGRQDIVAFGELETWIALSTGNGFAPPQGGVEDFAYIQGWRVGRHRRLLTDINNDGRADIVGFGEDAVWTALSHGDGFDAPVRAVNHFCAAQGFVEPRNWRFVADLNGDHYPEIVGIGDESVIRSIGGPNGFTNPRDMIRAFALGSGYSEKMYLSMPRMIGDVNGDGYQDLVAFGTVSVEVSKSFPEVPPLPPAAPTNLRVTAATEGTMDFAWNDNSDERQFFLRWKKTGGSVKSATLYQNTTTYHLASLEPDTEYCFSVQAESLWGKSAWTAYKCGRTLYPPTGTDGVVLFRDTPQAGIYHGSWDGRPARKPVRLWRDAFDGTAQIFLVRPGHTPLECFGPNHPQATVALPPNGSLGPLQIEQVLGGPAVPGAPASFLACGFDGSTFPSGLSFNLDWAP